ncbi:MAG TPA: hypothetical protein VNK51_01080, partial [Bradyrhizobium sp.]|nr:hypothetical protein [Bradyrhizobium sp.]
MAPQLPVARELIALKTVSSRTRAPWRRGWPGFDSEAAATARTRDALRRADIGHEAVEFGAQAGA